MLSKNVASQGVYLYAYNLTTRVPDTGDAANITGSWSKDGGAPTSGFTTANPTEIGGGVYWQPLSQGETNGNALAYYWASTTAGVQIQPLMVLTDKGGVQANVVQVLGTASAGAAGYVAADLTQAIPTSNTAQTLGDCLNAARAQGFGKWTIVGTTLTLFANDGVTAVRTFVLDSATSPTSRT